MSDKPTAPPVILFPIHGCEDEQVLSQEQVLKQCAAWRRTLRKEFTSPGVRAVIGLIEMTALRLTRDGIAPGGTEHDKGQAWGCNEMLAVIRSAINEEEEPVAKEEKD